MISLKYKLDFLFYLIYIGYFFGVCLFGRTITFERLILAGLEIMFGQAEHSLGLNFHVKIYKSRKEGMTVNRVNVGGE